MVVDSSLAYRRSPPHRWLRNTGAGSMAQTPGSPPHRWLRK